MHGGSTLGFAMGQELAVAWWRMFGSVGRRTGLEEARRWDQLQ